MLRRVDQFDGMDSRWRWFGLWSALAALIVASCGYDGGFGEAACDGDGDCPTLSECVDGVCIPAEPECDDGEEICGVVCVDTQHDPEHCGECGAECTTEVEGAEPVCDGGQCLAQCVGDAELCDVDGAQVCVDTKESVEHCGGCGQICTTEVEGAEPVCGGGECMEQCPAGEEICDSEEPSCVDTSKDLANCGGCGQVCTVDDPLGIAVCDDGQCKMKCDGFYEPCDGECVDFDSDPEHCGGCGHRCGDVEICVGGECAPEPCDPSADPFGGGDGSSGDPYRICTAAQLANIDPEDEGADTYLASHFELRDDIDLSTLEGDWSPIARANWNWDDEVYVGTFGGYFDGNGYGIEGLEVSTHLNRAGLFGVIGATGEVVDLDVEVVHIDGANLVGGLAGRNHGRIEGVSVWGSGDASIIGNAEVGGVVGHNRSFIEDSSVEGVEVESVTHKAGGVVGFNISSGELIGATANVTVSAHNYVGGLVGRNNGVIDDAEVSGGGVGGHSEVGGLVGYNSAYSANGFSFEGTIEESMANVEVTGHYRIGGLVGLSEGVIDDAEAGGDVTGHTYVGGLVGRIEDGEVVDSRASAEVDGTERIGGLAGRIDDGAVVRRTSADAVIDTSGYRVGGFVGLHQGTVKKSFAEGDVDAGGNAVGGFAGAFSGSGVVEDSYAVGTVAGNHNVGGFCGAFWGSATEPRIRRSYSAGDVTYNHGGGGLVGAGGEAEVEDSYWKKRSDGIQDSAAGVAVDEDAFDDANSFGGFDFGGVWEMGGERPRLWWE